MKNSWNILLSITTILAIGLFLTLYYLSRNNIESVEDDENIDRIELKLCNEDRISQYYMVTTDYDGGRKAIKNELLPIIERDGILFGKNIGNISIRFIVSCNGEIGLFRAKAINKRLETTGFNKSNVDYLISLVGGLDDWKVGTEKKYDSYYYINFKIRNGQVTDIF